MTGPELCHDMWSRNTHAAAERPSCGEPNARLRGPSFVSQTPSSTVTSVNAVCRRVSTCLGNASSPKSSVCERENREREREKAACRSRGLVLCYCYSTEVRVCDGEHSRGGTRRARAVLRRFEDSTGSFLCVGKLGNFNVTQ